MEFWVLDGLMGLGKFIAIVAPGQGNKSFNI